MKVTMTDTLKIRSTIPAGTLRRQLFVGSAIAAVGVMITLGTALSGSLVEEWGHALYGASVLLIAIGLAPYRRSVMHQLHPDEWIITADAIHYRTKGRRVFSVPLKSIGTVVQVPEGVGISLKKPIPERISVATRRFNMRRFTKQSQKKHGTDLFFPHFGTEAARELLEVLEGLDPSLDEVVHADQSHQPDSV
jgi:hypothetical protein